MKLYVVTPENPLESEPQLIEMMLDAGISRVHLRHPGISEIGMRRLLDKIPEKVLSAISLHDYHGLAVEYGTGIHLNHRHPYMLLDFKGTVSRSCHSIAEAAESANLSYRFLSPIYASISKKGYNPVMTRGELSQAFMSGILDRNVVALGGVEPSKFEELSHIGFSGAAMLGYVWGDGTVQDVKRRLAKICYSL